MSRVPKTDAERSKRTGRAAASVEAARTDQPATAVPFIVGCKSQM